jgi:hypothetical protein
MKTMILFSTPFGLENNIQEMKQRVVQYVGSRLIKNNPENAPLLELNSTIDSVDKEQISKLVEGVLDSAALFLIETNDDGFGGNSGNLCVLQPV